VRLPWEVSFWSPAIEVKNPDAFFTKKMYGLLEAGNVVAVPTLMGFNSEESLLFNQGMLTINCFERNKYYLCGSSSRSI
jgi:hypothetical protein